MTKGSYKYMRREYKSDRYWTRVMRRELVRLCGRHDVTRVQLADKIVFLWRDQPADMVPRLPRMLQPYWAAIKRCKLRYPKTDDVLKELEGA